MDAWAADIKDFVTSKFKAERYRRISSISKYQSIEKVVSGGCPLNIGRYLRNISLQVKVSKFIKTGQSLGHRSCPPPVR